MPRAQTPTIRECVERYMQSKAHMSEYTIRNQRLALQRFARAVGEDRAIGYLTAQQVERYFTRDLAGQQASSVNKMRQRVGHFLSYSMRHGWVTKDLMIDVRKRPVPRRDRPRVAAINLRGLLDLTDDPRNRGLLAVSVNTGFRALEIVNLRVRDVNLQAEEIYVYRSKVGRDDYVPMTPMLAQELRRWLTAYAQELGDTRMDSDMRLFPARTSPRWLPSVDGVRQRERFGTLKPHAPLHQPHAIVQRVLRDAGWADTKYQGLHTLRRSVARTFYDSLVDQNADDALGQTMTLLGHSQRATTEVYIGVDRERRRRDATLRQDFLPVAVGGNVVPIQGSAS